MKRVRKVFAFAVALVMALGIALPAFAAGTGEIAVTTNFKGQGYELYKLFDAKTVAGRTTGGEGITYTLMSGKTDLKATVNDQEVDGAQWFAIDSDGYVTSKEGYAPNNDAFKAWAKAYGAKQGDELVAEVNDDTDIKWTGLDEGYYYITTTTGSLVTVTSIAPNVTVVDKNSIPSGDKTITAVEAGSFNEAGKNAIAQVGKTVTFTATVDFGKGSKNVKFHDTMGTGLELITSSIKVTDVPKKDGADQYQILETPETGDTFTIVFDDGIDESVVAKIEYKATVTSDALTTAVAAGKNTATISYGENNTTTQEKTTQVYNAKFTVTKKDGNNQALKGAGFVIKNAAGKYYKITNGVVSWVDTEAQATENFSDDAGAVPAFTGLCDGTYTLVEKTVPNGYNKANDEDFTIAQGDYTTTNLEQGAIVTNNKGTEMPSTGGIGTTIFYVVGGVMVAGAVIFLLTKRRAASDAE